MTTLQKSNTKDHESHYEEDDDLFYLCPWKSKPNNVQILPNNQNGKPGEWTQLDISNVKLRFLSPAIALYSNLTELYLNNNQLTFLPEALFYSLTKLKHLDISSNLFTRLPEGISNLINLRVLNIQKNPIKELPLSMGKLFRLENLLLDAPLILQPPQEVVQQGTQAIVQYLREKMPVSEPPPSREWVYAHADLVHSTPPSVRRFDKSKLPGAVRVLCYNILAESYAPPERMTYCPLWALNWEYRKHRILAELLYYNPDILCLQEVESEQYSAYFEPELQAQGYVGVFRPKSRARTMSDWSKVDGCAVFFKHDAFTLVDVTLIEFQTIALQKHSVLTYNKKDTGFNRLITKDNIALCLLLQPVIGPTSSSPPLNNGEPLLVVNTHIHWDPEFCDVKLMQTQFLLEQLEALAARYCGEEPGNDHGTASLLRGDTPTGRERVGERSHNEENMNDEHSSSEKWSQLAMLVCGDFNSLPDSGVYQLLETRHVAGTHADFGTYDFGLYNVHGLRHRLELKSAYAMCGGEPPFTNFTHEFVGVLDYIWYTPRTLRVHKVLRGVDYDVVLKSYGALPNPFMCSDHISLVADIAPTRPLSATPATGTSLHLPLATLGPSTVSSSLVPLEQMHVHVNRHVVPASYSPFYPHSSPASSPPFYYTPDDATMDSSHLLHSQKDISDYPSKVVATRYNTPGINGYHP
jgi:CCR4-NOT transcription complex subunit 6